MPEPKITVFLADDNLIVREGVRALIGSAGDMEVVGVAGDYDGLVAGAELAAPQVVVTDIRMPPTFQNEGIEAAKQVRKRHPGTGIVVLSQYDEPDYAIALLSEGAAGYAYLLKDRVAEGATPAEDVAPGDRRSGRARGKPQPVAADGDRREAASRGSQARRDGNADRYRPDVGYPWLLDDCRGC